MNTEQQRAAFEAAKRAACKSQLGDFIKNGDGSYAANHLEQQFKGWLLANPAISAQPVSAGLTDEEILRAACEADLVYKDSAGDYCSGKHEDADMRLEVLAFSRALLSAAQRDSQPDHIADAGEMVAPNQPALVEQLFAALRSVNAVAIERGDPGACDQIDNDGKPYQSQWLADLLSADARQPVADTSADARDAARYRKLILALHAGDIEVGEAIIKMKVCGVCPNQSDIDTAIDALKEPTQ